MGGGGGGRVKGAKGANPSIPMGNFFIQLQYVIPQLTPLASPPALQSYDIRKLEEKRNNNSSNNKRKKRKTLYWPVGTHLRLILFIATHGLQHLHFGLSN